jgi:hypothetical protein
VPGVSPDAITASSRPRARAGCSGVELEGDVILVDDDSGAVHLLNPTARVVWSCFDGSTTIADIARDLDTVFAADRTTITDAVTDPACSRGHTRAMGRPSPVWRRPSRAPGATRGSRTGRRAPDRTTSTAWSGRVR